VIKKNRYSLTEFDGYKYRARLVVENKSGKQLLNVDVYTDSTSRSDTYAVLMRRIKTKFTDIDLDYSGIKAWISKEQDERTLKMLDELLNE